MKYLIPASLFALTLAACSSMPQMQQVELPEPPAPTPTYAAAPPAPLVNENNSLWTTSATSLLSMRRAKAVGDLLTVIVEMDDRASMKNSLQRTRGTNQEFNLDALFGLPEWANGVLPGGASLSPGIDYDRQSALDGSGAINRAEKVTFTLAARVIGLESNGNLVVQGYQQTRVSNEVRVLTVTGVIRAQDITRMNTVTYDKIADARLSYVSSGEATAPVQRGFVPKILDAVVPF
ncbi:flagellar basal body L-ring protein FlgH [Henriciella litoralis]|uniref:flagellar basal body L-ring protein FlgH n=1 Tax=Henriciella litoralis TaxID=568102 RepID=UPI001F39B2C2|nr:flagellar basal body L-ring protein FlgH [Henriciella litoralis]